MLNIKLITLIIIFINNTVIANEITTSSSTREKEIKLPVKTNTTNNKFTTENPQLYKSTTGFIFSIANQIKPKSNKGHFVEAIDVVNTSYILRPTRSQYEIENYVKQHSSSDINSSDIANKIKVVADCLEIDADMFTTLIRKESTFNISAVSPTQAKGLTQMTSAGLKEVNDQLGKEGSAYARFENTKYYKEKINSCIVPQLKMSPYVQVWERAGVNDMEAYKEQMIQDPNTSLIYGAILLKTLLADCSRDLASTASLEDKYRCALMAYNGDVKDNHYIKYAQKILEWHSSF